MVTDPVPESVTVTDESPCDIEFCERPFKPSSTYFFVATSPSATGVAVDSPVIKLVDASIVMSPIDNPFFTRKFLFAMVPFSPMVVSCYVICVKVSFTAVFTVKTKKGRPKPPFYYLGRIKTTY